MVLYTVILFPGTQLYCNVLNILYTNGREHAVCTLSNIVHAYPVRKYSDKLVRRFKARGYGPRYFIIRVRNGLNGFLAHWVKGSCARGQWPYPYTYVPMHTHSH